MYERKPKPGNSSQPYVRQGLERQATHKIELYLRVVNVCSLVNSLQTNCHPAAKILLMIILRFGRTTRSYSTVMGLSTQVGLPSALTANLNCHHVTRYATKPSYLSGIFRASFMILLFNPCAPTEPGLLTLMAITGCIVDERRRPLTNHRNPIKAAAAFPSCVSAYKQPHMVRRWHCFCIGCKHCPVA